MGKKKYGLEVVLLVGLIALIVGMFIDQWFAKGVQDWGG